MVALIVRTAILAAVRRLILAAGERLLVIDPASGEARSDLADRAPECLAVDAAGRVWCGTDGHGVLIGEDRGEVWREAGLEGAHVTAIAAAAEGKVVYAGTEPSAVFRRNGAEGAWSELRGLEALSSAGSWSFPPRPWTHHVRAILIDPRDPDLIHVAIEAGALVRSRDGGRTWQDRMPDGPIDSHRLAAHAAAPGWIGSAAGDGWFESEDGGETWQSPDKGLADGYLWSVAVDAADPGTVLVSAAPGPSRAHVARRAKSRIYRRSGGSDWQLVDGGLPERRGTTAAELLADPDEPGVFWAASNQGVHRSDDGGVTWRRVEIAWPEELRAVRVDALALLNA